MNLAADLWGKKWRAAVIWYIRDGEEHRFSQLKRTMPGCSVKVLSEVLKELEDNGLIIRTQYPTIPVKVTYRITSDFKIVVDHAEPMYHSFVKYVIKHRIRYKVSDEYVENMEHFLETLQ